MTRKIIQGVDKFPENEQLLNRRESTKELLIQPRPRFHGDRRVGCLLVRYRREEIYREHYLDIYKCLTHNVETCRCGWEWGWHHGGDSSKLK